ncbi:dihydrofolate reductase family protein [Virgibacillus salinus]|uniref:Dihydrofolate reductase n=1 Tax=Virgibacillus salinus TaxID=553311 RepID=A0A1H1BXY5_9BACI|nr:dihydrofolate reductase family protein [Virgibacillus salinus]SDQ56769.1 Dihydrofolate reductase [Virgibacillus salinus]
MNDSKTKLVFYGAISIDGYLARDDHSLDWLLGTEGEEEIGYPDFFSTIDIVIMGRKTYDQIMLNLPDDGFPYKGRECYVFSRLLTGSDNNVQYINDDIVNFTNSLKEKRGKRIWIVGGGEVLYPLLQERLVDEFYIQIAPTIMGRGIPLFLPNEKENELKLINVKHCKQFAELHYELK